MTPANLQVEVNDMSPRQFVGVVEAGAYSGLAPRTVRAMIAEGRLGGYRPCPGRVLVNLAELDALIRKSRGKPGTRGKYLRKALRG
jgi:excisionase family DNA binding protein